MKFAKFAKFRIKNHFFPRQAIPTIVWLYTVNTQYRVWFDLDNSLTRWRKTFLKFSKICNSRKSQNSVWKHHFFPSQAIPTTCWLFTVSTLVILNTEFGLIWTTPWPLTKKNFFKILKNLHFAKFAKFRIKNHFFPWQAIPTIFGFTLSLHWWYSIPSLVWFGQLLDPMKKTIFKILKNSQFAKSAKFRIKNHFFPWQAIPTTFGLHCHYTGDTQYRVWFDLGNSLTRWKTTIFKILKNSQFAKFAKFRMKTHFFPRHAIPTTFWLYTVITLVILNTEFGLIWTPPWPDEEELF